MVGRRPRVALVVAACAALVAAACTLVTSLDGLSDGDAAAANDGGDERSVVVDGGGDGNARPDAQGDGAAATSRYATAILADNPVLYYRFGETGGAPARDEVTGATTAYPVSGGVFGVAGALAGDSNTAITLDGSFKLKLSQLVDFAGQAQFSVEVWVSPSTAENGIGFVVDHEVWDRRRGWLLSANKGAIGFERWLDGGSSSIGVGDPAVDGRWRHVVMSFDGTTQRLYIDTVRRDVGPGSVPLTVIGVPWTVGGQNCSPCSGGFRGSIDELAIYGKALNEERIAAHFSAGR